MNSKYSSWLGHTRLTEVGSEHLSNETCPPEVCKIYLLLGMKMTGTVTVICLIFLESLSHSSPSQGHSREHLCTVSLSKVISSITLFPLSSIIENSLTAIKKTPKELDKAQLSSRREHRLSISLRFLHRNRLLQGLTLPP